MTVRCSICEKGEVQAGHCLNGECVASANLPMESEDARGTYHVDGSYTARTPGGTWHGTMRTSVVDDGFAEAIMRMLDATERTKTLLLYGPVGLCEGMGV